MFEFELELSQSATITRTNASHSSSSAQPSSQIPTMEGGLYPWQRQQIKQPRNGLPGTCRYADLAKPLPPPPVGQTWAQDASSREWRLVPLAAAAVAENDGGADAAVAEVVRAGGEDDDAAPACAAAVAVPAAPAIPVSPDRALAGARRHAVLPTDTFEGICLRYRVTPTELRRANRMLGNNLQLAPATLAIPAAHDGNATSLAARGAERKKEEKVAALLSGVSRGARHDLTCSEARAYLELADWDVDRAVADANEDYGDEGGRKVR